MSGPAHEIADEWQDYVLVCTCGWRSASRTKTEARKQWLEHRREHRAAEREGAAG